MKIVGVGCGPGMLTAEAARVIADASLIYGSARAIALARDAISPGCEVHEGLRGLTVPPGRRGRPLDGGPDACGARLPPG